MSETTSTPVVEYANRRQMEAFALKYRLTIPDRQRATRVGELAGRRTGSSVEYQDRKDYTTGDDLRTIDWRSYARNDRLTVKLYREEITPVVDIIIDASASMSVTPAKASRRMDLGYLFFLLARKLHASVHVFRLGEKLIPARGPLDFDALTDQRMSNPLPLLRASGAARRAGIKILMSDLMFPFAPPELTSTFPNADRLIILQLLSRFEADPPVGGAFRLEDAEDLRHLDLRLDQRTVDTYKRRLHNLTEEISRCVQLVDGRFATVREDESVDDMITHLLRARIIEV